MANDYARIIDAMRVGLQDDDFKDALISVFRAMEGLEARLDNMLLVALDNRAVEGTHHKQWVIDQMLRAMMLPEGYQQWRDIAPDWDEGIAP